MNNFSEKEDATLLLSSYDGNENIDELLTFFILIKKFDVSFNKEIYSPETFTKYFEILKSINLINDIDNKYSSEIFPKTLSKIFLLNTDWLRYFVNLVEIKNMTSAAKNLHITTAALSKAISGIEENLQLILFDRDKNFDELTHSGKIVYEKSKEILNSLFKLNKVFNEIKTGKTYGEIKVAWFYSWGKDIIFQSVKNFMSKYHNIYFKINLITWYEIEKFVSEGKFDIGFMPYKPSSDNLEIADTIEIEYAIVSSPQPKKNWNDFSYIVNCNSIGRFSRSNILNPWPDEEYKRKIIMECSSPYVAIKLCKSGFGAAYLPVSFIKKELDEGSLAIVADLPFNKLNQLYLVHRKEMFFSSFVLNEFITEIKNNLLNRKEVQY